MKLFTELICPVSPERADENRVRVTALGVIFMMAAFFVTGNALFSGVRTKLLYRMLGLYLPGLPAGKKDAVE